MVSSFEVTLGSVTEAREVVGSEYNIVGCHVVDLTRGTQISRENDLGNVQAMFVLEPYEGSASMRVLVYGTTFTNGCTTPKRAWLRTKSSPNIVVSRCILTVL